MAKAEIVAGQQGQINRYSGDWLIVDIGMSMEARSCGVWYGPGTLDAIEFRDLKNLVIRKAKDSAQLPLNLLIEAPLSVAFQPNGNPGRRAYDTYKKEYRDWHHNAGAATLLAAQFLLRELYECHTRRREVRLFEGHVSFKSEEDKRLEGEDKDRAESHKRDVLALKNAVWHRRRAQIFCPHQLQGDPTMDVESPFPFFARTLVPPVIRVNPVR